MARYPITDEGFYHLTSRGWERKDHAPFPDDRVETWAYQMECLAEDAKEHVCLKRMWKCQNWDQQEARILRARFGTPVPVTVERNITLEAET
jgi:hypothetical protein